MKGIKDKIGWFFGLLAMISGLWFFLIKEDQNDYLKLLVFSKTEGFRHSSIEEGQKMVQSLADQHGFEVIFSEEAEVFNERVLADINVIVFLNTTGDILDDTQQLELQRYIQAGGGFVGIHSATDTEYKWPYYNQLVGAYFESHPDPAEATIEVINRDHLSTRHLSQNWVHTDEWYNFRAIHPDINVLMEVNEATYQGGKNGPNHPMSWYRDFDGGRMWYTGLGHTEESYVEPLFIEHIWGGIQYAAGPMQRIDYRKSNIVPEENRFDIEILDDNLNEPMELEVLPNGNVVFIQRHGEVMLYDRLAKQTSLLHKFEVFTDFEDGLLGLALDPKVEENKQIYFFRSHPVDSMQIISSFTMDADYLSIDIKSEQILLTIPTQRLECCHAAGSLEFGPDQMLYIALGDNTNPFASDGYAPLDDRLGRSPWDARKSSANTDDLRGKILRIKVEQEGYSIPEGNLFPRDGSQGKPEIYIMGCRNPYRMAFDNHRGFLYWGDVGPDANKSDINRGPGGHDEINQARIAGNFGWPLFVGNNLPYHDYDWDTQKSGKLFDPLKPVNDSRYNTGEKTLPPAQPAFFWYSYDNSTEFPLLGNGGRTAMAGPTYYQYDYPDSESKFPKYYDGKLFIYEWMRGWMISVTLDEEGNYVRMERFLSKKKFSNPIDMVFGPEGDMYLLEYGNTWFEQNPDARLLRLSYNRSNRKPLAKIEAPLEYGKTPFHVTLSAIESYDLDGDSLTYVWRLEDQVISTEKETYFTFEQPGVFTVSLGVKDKEGALGSSSIKLKVGNALPKLSIDINGNSSFYWDNSVLNYQVSVSDDEDGTLGAGITEDELVITIDYLQEGFDRNVIAMEHGALSQLGMGRFLIENSDCNSCHQEEKKSIGPSFYAISKKYQMDSSAKKYLINKIQNGGSGVWGEVAMAAHPALVDSEAGSIVDYILSLGEDEIVHDLPSSGKYIFQKHINKETQGVYVLTASYEDKGGEIIGPLTQQKILILRGPIISAVNFDDGFRTRIMNIEPDMIPGLDEEFSLVIGEPGSHYVYEDIDFKNISEVNVTIMQHPQYMNGGILEFRMDSLGGEVLTSMNIEQGVLDIGPFDLKVNVSGFEERHDLFMLFRSEEAAPICAVTDIAFLR